MNAKTINFKPSSKTFELERTSSIMGISDVFSSRPSIYLNEFTLFVSYYYVIPNFIHEINIDSRKAHTWFTKKF